MTNRAGALESLMFVGTSDLAGLVRGKAFPLADLEERVMFGVGLTGSNIMLSAFGPIYVSPFGTYGDLKLVPDLSTRTAIPATETADIELVLGDIRTLENAAWSCCPRSFLRRGLDALEAEHGLRLLAAFEQEFVYTGVPDAPGTSYSFDRFRSAGSFPGRVFGVLRDADIVPDSFLPEYAARQFEITVKPRQGLRAADDAVLVREIVRACAALADARAAFSPVLEPAGVGNGTHIHFSLQDRSDRGVMYDAQSPFGISPRAQPFVAGVLEHLPALTALTAPSVASFFRLRPNKWAPVWANLGERDRGAAVRVCPLFGGDAATAARDFNVEFRVADATASPYMALGALVHAGLDGLRRNLALPRHPQGPGADYAAAGVRMLPRSLAQALDMLAATPAARGWLGDELLAAYLMFKRAEIDAVAALTDDETCRRYAEVY